MTAVRRLEAGTYPYNIEELRTTVERAVSQTQKQTAQEPVDAVTAAVKPAVIGEDVFWFASQV